jgi:hypothetical protein
MRGQKRNDLTRQVLAFSKDMDLHSASQDQVLDLDVMAEVEAFSRLVGVEGFLQLQASFHDSVNYYILTVCTPPLCLFVNRRLTMCQNVISGGTIEDEVRIQKERGVCFSERKILFYAAELASFHGHSLPHILTQNWVTGPLASSPPLPRHHPLQPKTIQHLRRLRRSPRPRRFQTGESIRRH